MGVGWECIPGVDRPLALKSQKGGPQFSTQVAIYIRAQCQSSDQYSKTEYAPRFLPTKQVALRKPLGSVIPFQNPENMANPNPSEFYFHVIKSTKKWQKSIISVPITRFRPPFPPLPFFSQILPREYSRHVPLAHVTTECTSHIAIIFFQTWRHPNPHNVRNPYPATFLCPKKEYFFYKYSHTWLK